MKTLKKLKGDSVNYEHACSILVMISIAYRTVKRAEAKIAFAWRNVIGSVFFFSVSNRGNLKQK